MSMDGELYARVRTLEKQVAALLDRHPEVRAVMERGSATFGFSAPIGAIQNSQSVKARLIREPDGSLVVEAYDAP